MDERFTEVVRESQQREGTCGKIINVALIVSRIMEKE